MILVLEYQEDRAHKIEVEYKSIEKLKEVFSQPIAIDAQDCYLVTDGKSVAVTHSPVTACKLVFSFSPNMESNDIVTIKVFDSSDTDVAMQVAGDIMNVDLVTDRQVASKISEKQIQNLN